MDGDNQPSNVMSERELLEIAGKIVYGWSTLGLFLEFEQIQMDRLEILFPNKDLSRRLETLFKYWHDVVVQCKENPRELLTAAFLEMNHRENACLVLPIPKVDEINNSLHKYRAKPDTIKKIHAIDFTPHDSSSQPNPGYMNMHHFPEGEISNSRAQSQGRSSSELKKPFNDSLCQSAHNDLNTHMLSVGALISDNHIGTVFVVGKKYAMTAWHVVRDVIQDQFGNIDTSKLDQAFINFNENPLQPALQRYYVEREPAFVDVNLDVAVLEIKGPFNLPQSVMLCQYDIDSTLVPDISLCGFGKPGSPKKHMEHGCQIIKPYSTVVTAAIAHMQTKQQNDEIMSDYYKRAIASVGKDSSLVDLGYSGYDNESKLLFNCFMEHGASGSPVLTPKLRHGTVYAVGVLTNAIPEFYFHMHKMVQASFPDAYRFEMGARMSHVYSSMLQTKPNLVQELFGS